MVLGARGVSTWRNLVLPGRPDSLLWRRSLIPTTSLYFLNTCAHLLSDRAEDGGVQQMGANCFRTGRVNVVIRQDLPEVVAAALNDRTRRLVYVLDDHVGAYATDAGLPDGYRKRLADRWERLFQPLLRRADTVVVSSSYLFHHLSRYGRVVRSNPVWAAATLEGLRARLSAPASPGTVQIAYLGTGSHQAELAFLQPVLLHLLRRREDVVLTLPAGTDWPREIAGHPRVRQRWPVPWFQYGEQLVTERYDICLYPSLETPFAAGRSRNKLTEQALTGAYGLFSNTWPHADEVLASGAGGLASNAIEDWIDAVEQAIAGLSAWRQQAGAVAAAIEALNDPAPQQAMWRELLGMDAPSGA